MQQVPSIGRIVHYRPFPNECGASDQGTFNGTDVHPAIITRVWHNADGEVKFVNLTVFPDAGAPFFFPGSREFSENAPGHWFWPPYVPPKK